MRWNTSSEPFLYLLEGCGKHLWHRLLAPISWESRTVVLAHYSWLALIHCRCIVAFVPVWVFENAESENCLPVQMLYSSWCIVVGLGWVDQWGWNADVAFYADTRFVTYNITLRRGKVLVHTFHVSCLTTKPHNLPNLMGFLKSVLGSCFNILTKLTMCLGSSQAELYSQV